MHAERRRWTLVCLAAIAACAIPGCPRVVPQRAAPPGLAVLPDLARALASADGRGIRAVFTTECRTACRGFVPHLLAKAGGYEAGRWTARLTEGELVDDLWRVAVSYERASAALEPLAWRDFRGRLLVRARLAISGPDREGFLRLDQGLVDLDLVGGPFDWKIRRFVPAEVYALRRETAGYRAGPALSGLPATPASTDAAARASRSRVASAWAALDADGDGALDLVATRGAEAFLLPGEGEGFGPARRMFRAEGAVRALAPADVDADGRVDLFVGVERGASRLLLDPAGAATWLPGFEVRGRVTAALFADFDGDGALDLFVAREWGPSGSRSPDLLFRGTGRGLRPQGQALGQGGSLAVCAGDLDDDGDLDLVVGGEAGARLWLNQGAARFVDGSRAAGLVVGGAVSACALGDVDSDGRLDLYLGEADPADGARGPRAGGSHVARAGGLWRSLAASGRLRVQRMSGLEARPTSWAGMLDHDGDGLLDLLTLGGGGASALWVNLGEARFVDGESVARAAVARASGGVVADLDGDGTLELVLDGDQGPAVRRFAADPELGRGVTLRLVARGPNRDALGCRVEVWAEGKRQVREVGLATGAPGGPPAEVHIGGAGALRLERVKVHWPDRSVERFVDLPQEGTVRLEQGGHATWAARRSGLGPTSRPAGGAPREAAGIAGPTSGPAAATDGPASRAAGPASGVATSLPATLAELEAEGRAGPEPLDRFAGARATLVLLVDSAGAEGQEACRRLAAAAHGRRGVRAHVLRLGGPALSCPLVQRVATARARGRVAALLPLLPLVVVADRSGTIRSLLGGPSLESLGAHLERLER